MKNAKTKVKIISLALCLTILLGGCQFGGRQVKFTLGLGGQDVFKIGKTTISLTQAKVYLCNYQNIYGNAFGLNLWQDKSTEDSLQQYVKDITISELARVVCMDQLAQEQKIVLTEDEKANVKKATKVYYKSLTKDEKEYMGADESIIEGLYEDYALADKLYKSLTERVDEEVSDDEARIMHAMQIYVASKDTADQIAQRLTTGEDFASLASEFNQASDIEITFGRGVMPKEVEDATFKMEDNQISSCITTSKGYYFIKCVSKYDEALTQQNKVTIAQEREKKAFNDIYDSYVQKIEKMKNDVLWNKLEIETSGKIKTNSFFTIYNQYCVQSAS